MVACQDLERNPRKMRQVPGQNPGQSAIKTENAAGPPVNPWTCGKKRQKCCRSADKDAEFWTWPLLFVFAPLVALCPHAQNRRRPVRMTVVILVCSLFGSIELCFPRSRYPSRNLSKSHFGLNDKYKITFSR